EEWWNNRHESDVSWKVDIAGRIAQAKQNATPHWQEAEQIDTELLAIKAKNSKLADRLKEEKDGKKQAKITKERNQLLKQITELEQRAKTERQTGDALYFPAFDLDIKNPHRQQEEVEHSSAELIAMLEESMERSMDALN